MKQSLLVAAALLLSLGSAQADPPRSGVKRTTDPSFIEPITPAGDEEVRVGCPSSPMPLAFVEVLGEHLLLVADQAGLDLVEQVGFFADVRDRERPDGPA